MKTIIAGSRGFDKYDVLRHFVTEYGLVTTVISGGAKGADKLGERYAREHKIPLVICPANWDVHGKRAGYIRNETMAELADALIAFWDGNSPGTKHMIDIATKRGLFVTVINTNTFEVTILQK